MMQVLVSLLAFQVGYHGCILLLPLMLKSGCVTPDGGNKVTDNVYSTCNVY